MNDRDMRMMYDGRNPYGSRGGYVVSSRGGRGRGRGRGRRGDRGMDYAERMPRDMRGADYRYDMPDREYRHDMPDGHYMHGGRQRAYEPIEFMGYCSGYYGSPDQDYGRSRDYGDMRGDYRAYNMSGRYPYHDYGYRDYGDYGETLSKEELEHWEHKLMSQLDEREKQMFHKDQIVQKVKSMGKEMHNFGEHEMYVTTLMMYTDYKHTIGQNPDMAIRLAYDWLSDKDVAVKGAEKLAVYYDCIVEGENE